MISAGLLGRERLRRLEDRGVVFEVALVRMAQAGALPSLADLLAEVRAGGGLSPRRRRLAGQGPTFGGGGRAGRFGAGRPGMPPGACGPGTAVRRLPACCSRLRHRPARARARGVQDRPLLATTLELCRFDGPNAHGRRHVVTLTERSQRMYRDRLASTAVQQEVTKADARTWSGRTRRSSGGCPT
jgi:hypothetical protein